MVLDKGVKGNLFSIPADRPSSLRILAQSLLAMLDDISSDPGIVCHGCILAFIKRRSSIATSKSQAIAASSVPFCGLLAWWQRIEEWRLMQVWNRSCPESRFPASDAVYDREI